MNTLKSVRPNIFYVKDNEGNLQKVIELVFLLDKADCRYNTEGEIIRERNIQDFRFLLAESNFDSLIKLLTEIKDLKESDLI